MNYPNQYPNIYYDSNQPIYSEPQQYINEDTSNNGIKAVGIGLSLLCLILLLLYVFGAFDSAPVTPTTITFTPPTSTSPSTTTTSTSPTATPPTSTPPTATPPTSTTTTSSAPVVTNVPDTRFRWLKNKKGLYLSSNKNSDQIGTDLIQWEKGDENGHKWRFNPNGTIENKAGRCIGTETNDSNNGTKIVLKQCGSTPNTAVVSANMKWSRNNVGNLVNGVGKCLSINRNTAVWGEQALQWDCFDYEVDGQVWMDDFDI